MDLAEQCAGQIDETSANKAKDAVVQACLQKTASFDLWIGRRENLVLIKRLVLLAIFQHI